MVLLRILCNNYNRIIYVARGGQGVKKITIYFDEEHTLSIDLSSDETDRFIEWFNGEGSVYKLSTSLRVYYIAKNHIRHINVSSV